MILANKLENQPVIDPGRKSRAKMFKEKSDILTMTQ